MGAFFYIKWFLLIALMATILSAFYLMSSQGEKTANKYSVVNPKFESIVNQLLPPSNRSALSVPQKAMNKVIAQKPPFAEDTFTIPLSEVIQFSAFY
ncbi:unnamed protein product [Anisakis simplex]|uniref:Membrane protein insertase YidC n=1 Tax=Anisakis simplex TaxID=6269 RepID=A0A0M3KAD8_ANISI|nr:unnamed protein product [Anisakis simplex]